MAPPISSFARLAIVKAVEMLFERLKARLLGRKPGSSLEFKGKALSFSFAPDLTLYSLFDAATKSEGTIASSSELFAGLAKITESYIDAQKERTKAQFVQAVQSSLFDSSSASSSADAIKVLEDQLTEIQVSTMAGIKRIIDTETTVMRNMGIDDGIRRISALQGVDDPVVFFAVVRDGHRCSECTRLHLLLDGVTPRVYKRSEVGAGYHKKGDSNPKLSGLHPFCRCALSVLTPGFGFEAGRVTWKGSNWNELEHQRSK